MRVVRGELGGGRLARAVEIHEVDVVSRGQVIHERADARARSGQRHVRIVYGNVEQSYFIVGLHEAWSRRSGAASVSSG